MMHRKRRSSLTSVILLLLLSLSGTAFASGDEQPLQLLNPPSQQQVSSPQTGADIMAQEIRDIAAPVHIQEDRTTEIIIGIILALVVLLLLYLFYRWRKKKSATPKSSSELAFLALLQAKQLFNDGKFEEYAENITEILRTFITRQFGIPATSKTTREFLNHIQQNDSPIHLSKEILGECLTQVDLIKFAKHSADKEAVLALESSIQSFIENSIKEECV